jgi:hypothetical protein
MNRRSFSSPVVVTIETALGRKRQYLINDLYKATAAMRWYKLRPPIDIRAVNPGIWLVATAALARAHEHPDPNAVEHACEMFMLLQEQPASWRECSARTRPSLTSREWNVVRLGREYRLGNRYQDKNRQRHPFHLERIRLVLGSLAYGSVRLVPSHRSTRIRTGVAVSGAQELVLRTAPGTQEGFDLDVINTAASGRLGFRADEDLSRCSADQEPAVACWAACTAFVLSSFAAPFLVEWPPGRTFVLL